MTEEEKEKHQESFRKIRTEMSKTVEVTVKVTNLHLRTLARRYHATASAGNEHLIGTAIYEIAGQQVQAELAEIQKNKS